MNSSQLSMAGPFRNDIIHHGQAELPAPPGTLEASKLLHGITLHDRWRKVGSAGRAQPLVHPIGRRRIVIVSESRRPTRAGCSPMWHRAQRGTRTMRLDAKNRRGNPLPRHMVINLAAGIQQNTSGNLINDRVDLSHVPSLLFSHLWCRALERSSRNMRIGCVATGSASGFASMLNVALRNRQCTKSKHDSAT